MHTSNEVKNSSQHGTLERYLADEIALNSALDLFCEEVETEFRETQSSHAVEEPLWRAWRAIVTMAASVPQASARRQKLVDFVLDVQKRPNLESGASPCVVQDDTVWQDLPVFGMEMREAWNLAAATNSSPEQQDMWINMNAWTATLVATVQARGLTSPDFSLYGIWTIRTALEETGPDSVALAAAAVWFVHASPTIYQFCVSGKTFDGKVAKPGSACKDREWRGFNQIRWAAWARQMQKSRPSVSDDATVEIVDAAVRAMKAVDGTRCERR